MPWTLFNHFWKLCLSLLVSINNLGAKVTWEQMHRFYLVNFSFMNGGVSTFCGKCLMDLSFWWFLNSLIDRSRLPFIKSHTKFVISCRKVMILTARYDIVIRIDGRILYNSLYCCYDALFLIVFNKNIPIYLNGFLPNWIRGIQVI